MWKGPEGAAWRLPETHREGETEMTSTLESAHADTSSPSGPTTSSAGRRSRTLPIAASGTALVMAVFSAFVVTVGDSVRSFHAGVAGEAWGLSGMSLGLAAALLTAGALADDLGHRRVLRHSAGLFAAASAVGAKLVAAFSEKESSERRSRDDRVIGEPVVSRLKPSLESLGRIQASSLCEGGEMLARLSAAPGCRRPDFFELEFVFDFAALAVYPQR